MAKTLIFFCLLVFLGASFGPAVSGQTTEFSYQGSLVNSSTPANGNFDFEFRLFNALSGGGQVGATLTRNGVAVSNGVFSVSLDFGANFPGADRYLDISVKPTGGGAFTPLAPRSQILSAPYAIKSALAENATNAVTAATVTGPITGANPSAMLTITNSQPGVSNPSPANPPPAALRGEATSTVNATIGVLGISSGTDAGAVTGLYQGSGQGSGVIGFATSTTGPTVGVSASVNSPNGTAIDAVIPPGGSGYLFLGSNGSQTLFTVDSAGNTSVGGSLSVFNSISIGNPVTSGITPVCRDGQSRLANCSSSLRYKTAVSSFPSGTQLVKRLQPITFNWKDGGMHDLGLGAEDVAAIEPLLVTYNKDGQVEGVKYDRIGVVLVNAVKEQQGHIESLQKNNTQLQTQVNELKSVVCSIKPDVEICKSMEK